MTSQQRIAFFIEDLDGGGEERIIANLANAFAERGYLTDLVLMRAEGSFLAQLNKAVQVVDLKARSGYTCVPNLVLYWRQARPDVLISTLDLANLIVLLVRCVFGFQTQVVIRLATTISRQTRAPLKKILERVLLTWIYPWADHVVAVSQGAAADLTAYAKVAPEKITTIYNPIITPDLLSKLEEPLEDEWFDVDGLPVVLGIGRLNKVKNFYGLVEAFARVRQHLPARLMILGEGEERFALEGLVKELGLIDDVRLPGFVINPYAYLKRAAVYVLSSDWEGLPTVLVEALACGAQVVSTDCPSGPREILDDGKYGWLTPVGDIDALAVAIQSVLAGEQKPLDSDWLEQFGLQAAAEKLIALIGV